MPKVAAIQLNARVSVEENLKTVALYVSQAADEGAELVVLPEMFCQMGSGRKRRLEIAEDEGSGPIQDFLSQLAQKHGVWIIAGTMPIKSDEERIFAACLVYNTKGEQVARYNKIHLFDATFNTTDESYCESSYTKPGHDIVMVDSPLGKIGLTVCYDVRFPELYRALINLGAEIIVVPSAFVNTTGKVHWHTLLKARAIENFCYIVASNQVGIHENARETYGHSLIVSPWGNILAEIDDDPGFIVADLNLNELYQIRQNMPIIDHRRLIIDNNAITLKTKVVKVDKN